MRVLRAPVASTTSVTAAILHVSVLHHKGNLLVRFDRKNSSVDLFTNFANVTVFGASDFETFHNAGLHPLAYIVTSKLKPLDSSCSAVFDISPQHLICPLLRNGRDILYANPGSRFLMWARPNNDGFAAVRA
jgi:hypothetical protein